MPYAQQCKLCSCRYATSSNARGKKKAGNDESIIPRILPCGHAFCDRCITNKLLSSAKAENGTDSCSVTCPFTFCQTKSALPDGDVKSLQVHKYLLGSLAVESTIRSQSASRLLKLLEKSPSELLMPQASLEKCLNCLQAAADVVCVKCDNTKMCQPCFLEVHSSRVLASHNSTHLSDKDKVQSQIETLMDGSCSDHPNKNREYFCVDCSVAMCADCAVLGSHSGHSLNRLELVNQEVIPKLVETRKLASKAVDLVHQTKKQISIEKIGNSGDGMLTNPILEKIEDKFLKLHALLQLKQHEIEESVYSATGNNSHLLKNFQEQVIVNGKKLEQLVTEIDQILSNPVYEKCCDFQLVNSTAEEMLNLPCHLKVNDLSECTDVKVDVKEELLESLSDLVSVSVDSTSLSRYELKAIADVPESELKSCPPVQSCSVAPSIRQPTEQVIHSASAMQAYNTQSSADDGRYSVMSSKRSSNSCSRQHSYSSLGSVESAKAYMPDFPLQNSRTNNRQPSIPFYEDDYSGMPNFGDTSSQHSYNTHSDRSSNSQALFSPEYPPYGYEPAPQSDLGKSAPFVHDYGHNAQVQRKHNYTQDARIDLRGGVFENFEQSARQYSNQLIGQDAQQFSARDIRLNDPHFKMSEDFSVYRAGAYPISPPLQNVVQPQVKMKPIGRGRGTPAPVFAPPPGVTPNYTTPQVKKKLYMHRPSEITERSLVVQVSHVESPDCFYIQHPQRAKCLKKTQQRINECCNASMPLTDIHGVKFLFARVNGLWKRGEVVKVLDRSVQVFCCDYGNTEQVKASELRPAVGSLLSLPRQAVKCYLQGIQPSDGGSSWTSACTDQMREVLNHTSAVTLVKLDSPTIETDSLPVDLLMRDQCATSVLSMRDYLVFTEQAVWDSPSCPYIPDEQVLNKSYLKPQPIREGEHLKLYITHVVSPNEIYAQVVNRYVDDNEPNKPLETSAEVVKLDSVMKDMGEKYSVPTSNMLYKVFIPKPGDAVAALYDGEWFRAKIMSLHPGHVKVKYVDYGNVEIIAADQIRVLFKEYKELPAQAVELSIHGVSPLSEKGTWSKQLCDGLAQMCTEGVCSAKIVSDGTSTQGPQAILTMTDTKENVAYVLVQNGLAKRSVEQVTKNEGIDCKCTYAESPGEFYVLPLHLFAKFTEMTAKLDEAMQAEESAADTAASDYQWQVNDNCTLKYGGSWVRAIVEEVVSDTARCKLRLIDSGHVISRPQASLKVTPEMANYTAMTTRACIAGIVPAGGSKAWGPTAKDTIKELIEGCESCKVIPVGEAKDQLPCDILLPEELPSKIPGLQGEIIYVSVKEKLLDTGVALRAGKTAESAADEKKSRGKKLLQDSQSADNQNTRKNPLVEKLVRETSEEFQVPTQSQEVAGKVNRSPTNHITESSSQKSEDVELKLTKLDDMTAEPVKQEAAAASLIVGDALEKLKFTSPLTDTYSPAKTQTTDYSRKANFKVKNSGGSRLIKSPGGTIRSQVTEELPDHSLQFSDSTDRLLREAANRLAANGDATPVRPEPSYHNALGSSSSSDSSPDIPTPELNLKLATLVAKLTP